jgi:hypothetical protein
MKHYESEITQFLRELKAANPHIEQDQLYGRSLLWDKPSPTREDRERLQASRVPKAAYEYYNWPKPRS